MNTLNAIVWLFPVVFMLHEFEEIIVTKSWQKRFQRERETLKGKGPFSDFISAESFSCAVVEEFLIISAATLISCLTNNYLIWFGFYFACILHFILHLAICLQFHHYVPGAVTAVLLFPVSTYNLHKGVVLMQVSIMELIVYAVIGTVFLLLNLKLLHKLMKPFEKRVQRLAATPTDKIS
jgi:hypothetical protein